MDKVMVWAFLEELFFKFHLNTYVVFLFPSSNKVLLIGKRDVAEISLMNDKSGPPPPNGFVRDHILPY